MTTQEPKGTGERLLSLIKVLAEVDGPFRVSDIAKRLLLSPSTVHRMFQVLGQERMLEDGPGRTYVIGSELYRVSALVMGKYDLVRVAKRFARQVVSECDEVCFFCQYLPAQHQIVPMVAEYGKNPLRYAIDLLSPMTAAWGASGVSIVAFLPADDRQRVWANMGPSPAAGEPRPSLDRYEAQLAKIRFAGFAQTRAKKMPGAVGIAAPVFGSAGEPIGSLCVTVPEMRFNAGMVDTIGKVLLDHAERMSASLGAPQATRREAAGA